MGFLALLRLDMQPGWSFTLVLACICIGVHKCFSQWMETGEWPAFEFICFAVIMGSLAQYTWNKRNPAARQLPDDTSSSAKRENEVHENGLLTAALFKDSSAPT